MKEMTVQVRRFKPRHAWMNNILQGWDTETGWPTRERLAELAKEDVYEPMVAGARRAKAELPEPPRAEPVPLIHG